MKRFFVAVFASAAVLCAALPASAAVPSAVLYEGDAAVSQSVAINASGDYAIAWSSTDFRLNPDRTPAFGFFGRFDDAVVPAQEQLSGPIGEHAQALVALNGTRMITWDESVERSDQIRAKILDADGQSTTLSVSAGFHSISPNGTTYSATIRGRDVFVANRPPNGLFSEGHAVARRLGHGSIYLHDVYFDSQGAPIVVWYRNGENCPSGSPGSEAVETALNIPKCRPIPAMTYVSRLDATGNWSKPIATASNCLRVRFLSASPGSVFFVAECNYQHILLLKVRSDGRTERSVLASTGRFYPSSFSATMLDERRFAVVFDQHDPKDLRMDTFRLSIVRGRLGGEATTPKPLTKFERHAPASGEEPPRPWVVPVNGRPVVIWNDRGRMVLTDVKASRNRASTTLLVGRGATDVEIALASSGKGIVAWTRYTGDRRIRLRVKPFGVN